jgi:membrane protease YdiL (CAAX protease family)
MLPPATRDAAPSLRRTGRFDPWKTGVWALLWLAIIVTGWSPLVESTPTSWLHYPVDSAERITTRDLELAEAIERAPGVERALLQALFGTLDEALEGSTEIQRELVSGLAEGRVFSDDPAALDRARARLSLLLAETGSLEEALATAVGWYSDRARIARAERAGESEAASAIETQLVERGRRWKRRSVAVFGANIALVGLGAAVLATRLRRVRELFGGNPAPPPWTLEDGLGVFVRGDCWNRLYFLAIGYLDRIPLVGPQLASSTAAELLQTWATLFASLPLVWLVGRHLLAPARRPAALVFGLRRPGLGLARIARVGLAAIAIDLVGTYALGWTTWGLGVHSDWAEGFDEMLVWGSPGQALLTSADYVLWAPLMEELAFRGVLYFSLRHRLGPTHAALLTAVFFAAMHFYSLPGFLMTMWSGFVWALAFERLQSLLPGIAAHAVYNALFVLGLVLLYR